MLAIIDFKYFNHKSHLNFINFLNFSIFQAKILQSLVCYLIFKIKSSCNHE